MVDAVKIRIGATGERRRWWALGNACISVLMALLDVTIVNVALPTLQRDLNARFDQLEWIVNAYALALAVVLVTGGRLSDMFGRRLFLIIGLCIFTLGSVLAGLSGVFSFGFIPKIDALLGARVIQGAGSAIMLPVSLAIVSQAFEGRSKGVAIGLWGAMSGLGLAAGPLVGGLLISRFGWPSIFFLNVPIGIASILLSLLTIDESRDEHAGSAVDWWGTLALSTAIFMLVWGLIRLDAIQGRSIADIAWPFAVAAASFAVLVWVELRIEQPMIDFNLFRNRSFTGDALAVFSLSAALVAFIFFLTLYLQNALGFDPLQTGIRLLPMTVLVGICAPIAGRFTDAVGPRWIITCGLALAAVGAYLATRITPADTQAQWSVLVPTFVLLGIGLGAANAPINTVAVGTVDEGRAGLASGVINVCRQIGTAFGIAFLGLFLTNHYDAAVARTIAHVRAPQLDAQRRTHLTGAIVKAGPQAGSAGLAQAPRRLKQLPLFPQISKATRAAWIESFALTMKISAALVLAGACAAALLIRREDLRSTANGDQDSGKRRKRTSSA